MSRVARWLAHVAAVVRPGNWLGRLRFAARVWLQDPTIYPLSRYQAFDVDRCAALFLRNHTLLHTYAATLGARCLTYLQPFNGFGSRLASRHDVAALAHMRRRITVDGAYEIHAMHEFYRRLIAEFPLHSPLAFRDLTAIFDNVADVYIDQAHCSDRGYDLLAKRLAEDILSKEADAR